MCETGGDLLALGRVKFFGSPAWHQPQVRAWSEPLQGQDAGLKRGLIHHSLIDKGRVITIGATRHPDDL
jgi:hypothetical protein